jgi:outer membrane protein assembly factor BamB
VDVGGRQELVFHRSVGNPATLAAVDPRTGAALWQCGVLRDYLVPSPVAHDGVVYTIAYQKGAAVRAGGRGDVTGSNVVWAINKGSEVCSPVYSDGHLYWTSEDGGIAYCVDAKTGTGVYQERLEPEPGRIYASGVLAGGRIYYTSREKGTYVVAAKPKFELLAHNVIETDESVFNGTPAVSRGQLFLRSDRYLYCIGGK